MARATLSLLIERFRAFRNDEDGAVTTDFVVLTASVMMMGAAHARDVALATTEIGDDVSSCLSQDIGDFVDNIDPDNFVAQLEAAGAACSSR